MVALLWAEWLNERSVDRCKYCFACLFILLLFPLKAEWYMAWMPLGGVSTQPLTAAPERLKWSAHTHTYFCVLARAHTNKHTSIFSSVVLPTDFPSSCKNSAVFGEINAFVSLMQSHAHTHTLVYAPESGGAFMKRLDSYFADHHHPHSVNLNQAVARRKHFHMQNHSSLKSAELWVLFMTVMWVKGKKRETPPIWLFAFREVLFISQQF